MTDDVRASATASEALVAEAMRGISDVSVIIFDRTLRIEAVRGGAARRHGYVPERIVGRRAPDVLPAAAWERLGPLYARALTGETVTVDMPSHDAAAIYETTFQPVHRDGVLIGGMAVAKDVTARRAAEADLHRTARRFRAMAESAVEGHCLLSPSGEVRWFSPSMRKLLCWGDEEVGRDGREHVHADDRGKHDAAFAGVVDRREPSTVELRMRHADGGWCWVETTFRPMVEPSGELVEVHAIARATDGPGEDARRALLGQFETSFNRAPIGMCLVDLDGRFRRVNPALCELLGRQETDLLACDFQQITHPDDLDADLGLLTDTLAGRRTGYELDKRYVRPDGTVIECRLSVALVRDAADRPAHFVSQIVDLSALHGVRRDLAQARSRLQAILDHSPAAIYTRDLEQHWEVVNPETCRIVGLPEDELVGRSMRDTLSPELFEHLDGHDRQVLAAGEAITFDEMAPDARTGRKHYWWSSKFPIRDASGEVVGLGGMSFDVTDREETMLELHAAQQLFEAAFESAPVGKLVSRRLADGSTEVMKANPAFAEMLGLEVAQLVGSDPIVLVHPEDLPVRARMIEDMLAGRPSPGEMRFRHRDGRFIWTLVAPATVRAANGEVLFILQALEISERKRVEARLQHRADHDSLTGLMSRRRFEEDLEREVARVRRAGGASSLLLLDLDGFKFVNDTFGHSAGDELLTRIGAALRRVLREVDVLARLGGDEFAVVLPDTDVTGSRAVAEKLVDAVRACGRVVVGDTHAVVTTSVGITSIAADSDADAKSLLVEADAALYQAKNAGRDGLAVYRQDEHPR